MKNAGQAVFGVGTAKGENRISQALDAALHSSLLTLSMKGAKGVLLNIAGSGDVSLHEAQTAAEKVKQETASGAKIIFGAVEDKHLKKGEVKITLIATGFRS
jgi:cell division protein FtsZ